MVNLILLFALFLSARTLLIKENVIFRKINEISPTRTTWAIAVLTVFDTYDDHSTFITKKNHLPLINTQVRICPPYIQLVVRGDKMGRFLGITEKKNYPLGIRSTHSRLDHGDTFRLL